MNLANEGLEAKKKEDEVLAKKRKAEDDASWEGLSLKTLSTSGADLPISRQRTENNALAAGGRLARTRKRRRSRR